MAFLFKSKKSHDKAAAAAKAENANLVAASQAPPQGTNGRPSKEQKDGAALSETPTPTSSVNNSINSFHGNAPSPDPQGPARRGPSSDQASDLPVSLPPCYAEAVTHPRRQSW